MKVGNYSFELKAFKYLESRSEETYCFSAVLYVNGTNWHIAVTTGTVAPPMSVSFPNVLKRAG